MAKKQILKILAGIFFTILVAGCKPEATYVDGYTDKNELIKDFTKAVFNNDTRAVTKCLVHKNEYRELIHPYSADADVKHGGMKADDFWSTFIIQRRDLAIGGYLNKFAGKKCRLEKTGNPGKIIKYAHLKYIRETRITFSCEGDDGKRHIETDSRLFGVIAEKGGKYKLLNSFND